MYGLQCSLGRSRGTLRLMPLVILALALGAATVGCGADSTDDQLVRSAGPTETRYADDDEQLAPSPVDADAQEAMADGVVDEEEWRATIVRVFDCARTRGAEVAGPVFGAEGLYDPFAISAEDAILWDQCYEEVGRAVDIAYQTQDESVIAVEESAARVVACLEDQGIDVGALAQDALDVRNEGFPSDAHVSLDELSIDEMVSFATQALAGSNPDALGECAPS